MHQALCKTGNITVEDPCCLIVKSGKAFFFPLVYEDKKNKIRDFKEENINWGWKVEFFSYKSY